MEKMHFQLKPHSFQLQLWKLYSIGLMLMTIATKCGQAHQGCVFHDGSFAESDGVRFIRLREDAPIGKEILSFKAYPKSKIALQSSENNGDHKYFSGHDLNATTVVVTLTRSLEDLVDRDVPRNILKFRIVCLSQNEKLEEGSSLSVTVYIEDVNDNKPEFLNIPYVVDVLENIPTGTILFEGIQAFDRDKPNTPNSEIHFSMSTVPEQLSNDGSPYFALKSPHKPLLILRKQLDFDNGIRVFKLPLFAWDRGTPANQVNTTIIINVKDVDDLPPKFTEGVYRTKINEFYPITGMAIRVALYFNPPVMAYDQDSLNATLIYDIISGNERKLFRANPNNGVIYLQKEIDLEEESLPGNTFVLQIEARQKDNPLQKAVARIEVEIIDLNDNYPEFEADFYNISIVENLPSGFSVLQVNAIDRDQGENADFLYNLKEQKKNSGAFLIDSRTGWIMVKNDNLLDREKRKSLHLEVEAIERIPSYIDEKQSRKPGPTFVKVEITLLDTNDNTPKFENGNLYEFKLPITSPIGYKIGQVVAFDPDEGPNGQLLYELQRPKKSGFIPFGLDAQNGTIYVSGPIRQGRIAIFVEASDQPINPSERRFSLAVVTVEVYATIDDQAIDFVGAPYEFWIGSDAVLGASVGQVRTTLVHESDDEIMYDLLHTYSEGVPFAIEERSGIITVIRELNNFQRKLYHFEAVANYLFSNLSQSSFMPRSSSALTTVPAPDLTDEGVLITNVTIHVVSNNESRLPFKPIIEEINMKVIKFHVAENVAGGVIGQLLHKNALNADNNGLEAFRTLKTPKPTDIDIDMVGSKFRSRNRKQRQTRKEKIPRRLTGDPNIKLRYIIANQQDVINKITITEDGTLLTLVGLDREEKAKYDLTIIVEYTTGLVSGAGIYQVEIIIDDVNDNAPEFSDHHYFGLIKENTIKGAQVALNKLIVIKDRDAGINGEFQVSLQGDYNDLFKIELVQQENATVLNTIALRPEMFHVYNVTEQWNEELKFLEMQSELKPMHLKVNNQPFFKITYTGLRPLDREKEQIYHLKIMAIDNGGLHTYATLYVLISDVNDNYPIFERISVFKDSQIEIREYTTEMEIYFVESALVMMSPFSMTLPPYFLAGAPRSMDSFMANATNILKVAGKARIKGKSRNIRAVGSKGAPNCPLFAVYENISMNTKILQISASDEDYGRNAQVEYEISSEQVHKPLSGPNFSKLVGIKYFTIDKLSGELMINYPLAANIDIWLNLTASDIDDLKDTTCLHFTVIDVNNHAPTFKKSSYSFDIEEGDYRDSVLGQVLAVDYDFDQNANITYSLKSNNLPFAIKPFSGVIRITANLDRELKDKYNFQVIASDGAEPKLRMSSSVDVEINILDVNDNKPVFIGYDDIIKAELYINNIADRTLQVPLFKAFLDRNTKPGTFVKQITAIDKDYMGNGNGLVLYSLLPQENHPQPIFQIDFRDGNIVTVSNFRGFNDYEHLNITVVASDLGSPALSSTAVVLINLQGHAISEPITSPEDQLDWQNRSLFRHQYYEIQIMENNEVPLEVMKLNYSFDFNTELLRWSLWVEEGIDMEPNTHPPFEFDAKLSTLYALKSFDREIVARYQLRLRAEKYSRESRTFSRLKYPVNDERLEGVENNECRIVVKIIDDNDNFPKFKGGSKPIIAVVPKTAVFGYPVTNVEATDADINLNAEIRYKLLNEPSRMFGIDEYTGKIRLIANIEPTDTRVHGFDIKATDRAGADDGHSSIVNVFVYIIDERKQVRIVVAGKPVEVERKIDALVDALSNAIGIEIRVRLLEPHFGSLEPATDAYIYAVDHQTNSLVEMEQLQQSLAGLQLDVLQLKQQQHQQQQHPKKNGKWNASKIMPRIIALAEFGQLPRKPSHGTAFWTNLEIITVIMLSFCGVGGILIAMCFVCPRQRRGIWSQQEFPSSETGLTYAIARAGLDSCRRRHQQQQQHQHLSQQQPQHLNHHQQHQHQTQSQPPHQAAHKNNAQHRHSQQSLLSVKTQSTAIAAQKMEKEWSLVPHQQPTITPASLHAHHHVQHSSLQPHQHHHQHHLHHHHHHNHQQLHQHHQHHKLQQQQQHQHEQQQQQNKQNQQYGQQLQHQHQQHYQHLNGEKKPREYIDVPLPKSVTALRSNINSIEQDEKNSKFILNYNSCQPVNNLQNPQKYETSMFSLYSNGQDSGIDFLSSRELYETSPDSFDSQPSKLPLPPLCPRHDKDNVTSKGKPSNTCNTDSSFNSSDNYEDSLQNDNALEATTNCRSLCERHLQQHKHRQLELYQASHFEKRSCVRHSFSGVKDDLMQNSPRINMRSRGNILRNSMNDLEQRLINLEQSFRRPTNFHKNNSML